MNENCQTYQKHEESPPRFEQGKYTGSEVAVTGPVNRLHSSASSESPVTTSRDFSNNAAQSDDTGTAYTYARMNWDRSNVISSTAPSDRDSTWFDIHSPIVQTTWNSVSHLSRDEMFAEFWKVKPYRLHYGSQPGKISKHHASGARTLELGTQGQRHKVAELFRRTRHRVCQRGLHFMTCERAKVLAENDDIYSLYRVSGGNNVCALHGSKAASAFKAPSKDDQLMASMYMQALSAIGVHSEHEGRIKAERLAEELEIKLKRKEKYELGE